MPRKKASARASSRNIQIINQRRIERDRDDIKSESVQYHDPQKSQWSQFKQFCLTLETRQTPLLLPTQNLFWTLSWQTSAHIFTSHLMSGSSMIVRMTVMILICYTPHVILVPCVYLCLPLPRSYLICMTGPLIAVYWTHFGLSR